MNDNQKRAVGPIAALAVSVAMWLGIIQIIKKLSPWKFL